MNLITVFLTVACLAVGAGLGATGHLYSAFAERNHMATKERLAAMAASLCAVCSGAMVIKLVKADPNNGACELRTYTCADCGHTRTYSVAAGNS